MKTTPLLLRCIFLALAAGSCFVAAAQQDYGQQAAAVQTQIYQIDQAIGQWTAYISTDNLYWNVNNDSTTNWYYLNDANFHAQYDNWAQQTAAQGQQYIQQLQYQRAALAQQLQALNYAQAQQYAQTQQYSQPQQATPDNGTAYKMDPQAAQPTSQTPPQGSARCPDGSIMLLNVCSGASSELPRR